MAHEPTRGTVQDALSSSQPQASSSYAPYRPIPRAGYGSVEYPSTVSHPSAILRLVSQEKINECFNAPADSNKSQLEIRLGGSERPGVPIRGLRVPSQKLLLKITRRRRRAPEGGPSRSGKEAMREGAEEGVFVSEVVGPIPQTVRFRSMADWKSTPNPEGRIAALTAALRDVDYDQILAYTVPSTPDALFEPGDTEDYRSLLDLQPPPIFSAQRVPLIYNFRNHPATTLEKYEDEETGEIKTRYANRARFVTKSLQKISPMHKPGDVPSGPKKNVRDKIKTLEPRILERFRQLLETRPVWARHALLAQFSLADQKTIEQSKYYFPAVVYTFGAGPFWKTVVRYGYDPCADPNAAIWQRIYFYVNVHREGRLQAVDEESESEAEASKTHAEWRVEQERLAKEGLRPPLDLSKEYIFDGKILHSIKADFQLCDITDPLIRRYIDDPKNRSATFGPEHGWYEPKALELIKTLTRIKYIHIREKNEPAPDAICHGALLDYAKKTQGNESGADEANENGEMTATPAREDVEMD